MLLDLLNIIDNKTWELIALFGAYLTSIAVFGLVYWHIYSRDPSAFAFNADIFKRQVFTVESAAVEKLSKMKKVLPLLQEADTYLKSNDPLMIPMPSKWYKFGERWETFLGNLHFTMQIQNVGSPPAGPMTTIYAITVEDISRGENFSYEVMRDPLDDLTFPELVDRWKARLEVDIDTTEHRLTSLWTESSQVWSLMGFLYFSLISQTTVGFGDILPNNTRIRTLVGMQILIGYLMLVVVINVILTA